MVEKCEDATLTLLRTSLIQLNRGYCLRVLVLVVWGMTQHRDPGGCSFSPQSHQPPPHPPDSPQTSLVHSVLPLLAPRLSGCKWNCVIWPFKKLCAPQLSLPGREKSCCFSQLKVIWVPFWPCCCRLGSLAWGLDPILLRRNPQPLKYPSWTSAATRGSPASPLAPPPHSFLVTLCWSVFFCLSLVVSKASLQLAFGWLFWISLQFSCTRLVLGAS